MKPWPMFRARRQHGLLQPAPSIGLGRNNSGDTEIATARNVGAQFLSLCSRRQGDWKLNGLRGLRHNQHPRSSSRAQRSRSLDTLTTLRRMQGPHADHCGAGRSAGSRRCFRTPAPASGPLAVIARRSLRISLRACAARPLPLPGSPCVSRNCCMRSLQHSPACGDEHCSSRR